MSWENQPYLVNGVYNSYCNKRSVSVCPWFVKLIWCQFYSNNTSTLTTTFDTTARCHNIYLTPITRSHITISKRSVNSHQQHGVSAIKKKKKKHSKHDSSTWWKDVFSRTFLFVVVVLLVPSFPPYFFRFLWNECVRVGIGFGVRWCQGDHMAAVVILYIGSVSIQYNLFWRMLATLSILCICSLFINLELMKVASKVIDSALTEEMFLFCPSCYLLQSLCNHCHTFRNSQFYFRFQMCSTTKSAVPRNFRIYEKVNTMAKIITVSSSPPYYYYY